MMRTVILTLLVVSVLPAQVEWFNRKDYHVLQEVKSQEVKRIVNRMNDKNGFESILDPILISRVPGTTGNERVRQYIIKFMSDLNWKIEQDSFNDSTPFGVKSFTNVIATLDPSAPRQLVLACHYDSKLNREYTFIAATDSAVPCAMMMSLAKNLDEMLKKPRLNALDVSLQLVFFDGEEAFVQWTSTDSIYGARHLASKWEKSPYPKDNEDNTNELDRKDALILLDLLGAPNPSIYNYFTETKHLHEALVSIETKLHDDKLLTRHKSSNYFKSTFMRAGIEDDHIPFQEKGVAILHLIPVPFPKVWHREDDNKDNLDFNVIINLNKILSVFLVQYLHLPTDDTS